MYLSICTPTYNRDYTLERVYSSLIKQGNKKFEWIVVDDGSNDNTESLVKEWINEDKIKILYYKQKNQGKHVALNKGLLLANGNVFTCLDSDDWFFDNTVDEISVLYNKIKKEKEIAGIIALDSFENNQVIGTDFSHIDKQTINWLDLMYKYKMKGDKAYFFKTDILKRYPFPSFEGNKHMPPSYQYYQLSKEYKFLVHNKQLKYVEYLEDGISSNKYNKYLIAPDNFSQYRLSIAKLIPSKKRKVVNAIHFNATQYLGNIKIVPTDTNTKILFKIFKPIGYILGKFIESKVNLSKNISHEIKKKTR